MNRPKLVVTRRWPKEVEDQLCESFDTELNESDVPMTTAQLRDALARADALLPTVSDRIDAEVLSTGELRARLIASYGVGFNHIDTAAARKRGLTVTNTPDVLTDCTADLAMTLILMAARRTGEGERHLRAGEWTGWRPTHMMGTKVTGKTCGIIGMGRIGKAVARRAHHGFGMKILCYDRLPVDAAFLQEAGAEQCSSMDDVFSRSDFLSLHCPATPETRHLVNAERLSLMPPHAILINTARGDVVDEHALAKALKDRDIAAAGLDVFEEEPRVAPELLALENAVLLPHLGSATTETRVAMGERVLRNVRQFFAGETPTDKVT